MVEPVVNTSPLILLSKIGHLDLLRLAGDVVLVPEPVAHEVKTYWDDSTAKAMAAMPWLKVVAAPEAPSFLGERGLGAGEASVISWAIAHPGTETILDDKVARRCAHELGIRVRGTLGLVILAKHRGIIPAARPLLKRLRREGMYFSESLMNDVLRLVGE
jgi:predicted nucleic acid-binding protein